MLIKTPYARKRPEVYASFFRGRRGDRRADYRDFDERNIERLILYHNPACSHSRGALELLNGRGVEFETIEYLKTPPTRADLESIIAILEEPVADLVRKDKRFGELKLKAEDYTAREPVIDLLLKHPELIQRPIVIRKRRAIIARPAEKLSALF
ncbi:MAG TPA: ArsC/Spx/MgsR family protein [Candidatus Binataceae bacterium]